MIKLVRDKIPDIIKKSGKLAKIRIAGDKEFREKLNEKLKEEVEEYLESENKEELADIQGVLRAIYKLNQYSKAEIEQIRFQYHQYFIDNSS
jgi:predicted house-cleaning noncanonical NTP pyrophosphatase (MazG superfamily)